MPNRRVAAKSPKSRPSSSPAGGRVTLGIDIGATKVVSALVDDLGRVVRHSGRHLHSNNGPAGVVATALRSVRECLGPAGQPPSRIGVSVAAQVDPGSGAVVYAPNLRWHDVPLGEMLSRELGGEVRVVNDARAATFAEWQAGAGRGERDLFCLVLGTGVGGSAVLGGSLAEGGSHSAGEVGHITIVSEGRRCHCPNSGCFEAYVGGWAIAERAVEAVRENRPADSTLVSLAGSADAITAETVFRAGRAGDPLARRLIEETTRYLEDGVVSVVNAFDPSLLVLAGGLVTGRPEWVPTVAAAIRQRCQPAAARAWVVAASLGEDAGVVGAALMASSRARPPG